MRYILVVFLTAFICYSCSKKCFYCREAAIVPENKNQIAKLISSSDTEKFYFYNFEVEKCPGAFGHSCKRFISVYDPNSKPKLNQLDYDFDCFSLKEDQAIILPFDDYYIFFSEINDSLSINMLSNMDFNENIFENTLFIKRDGNISLLMLKNVEVFTYRMKYQFFNQLFYDLPGIYPYAKNNYINVILLKEK